MRARKAVLGVNALEATRGRVYVLFADRSASQNTVKEIMKLRTRFSCPVVMTEGLEELTGKANCKLVAVRDEQLARAAYAAATDGGDLGEGTDHGI